MGISGRGNHGSHDAVFTSLLFILVPPLEEGTSLCKLCGGGRNGWDKACRHRPPTGSVPSAGLATVCRTLNPCLSDDVSLSAPRRWLDTRWPALQDHPPGVCGAGAHEIASVSLSSQSEFFPPERLKQHHPSSKLAALLFKLLSPSGDEPWVTPCRATTQSSSEPRVQPGLTREASRGCEVSSG